MWPSDQRAGLRVLWGNREEPLIPCGEEEGTTAFPLSQPAVGGTLEGFGNICTQSWIFFHFWNLRYMRFLRKPTCVWYTAYSWGLRPNMASLPGPEAQGKPKWRVWALLRIGHFQMGVSENMLHQVCKPLGRPKRTFLERTKSPHEVYASNFRHAFSISFSTGEPRSVQGKCLDTQTYSFRVPQSSFERISDKEHSKSCATLPCLLKQNQQ